MKKYILSIILTLIPLTLCAWGVGMSGVSLLSGSEESTEITDNFSTNTAADYTGLLYAGDTGAITVSGGVAYGSTNWINNILYHKTPLSSVDHYAQAVVSENDYDGGGVLVRCDGTAGHFYRLNWNGNNITIYRGTDALGEASYNGSYLSSSGTHTIKLEVSGSGATVNLKAYVDGTLRINKDDTEAGRLTTGSYAGVIFDRENGASVTVDDFEAGAL